MHSQKGFTPVLIIIVVAILAGAGVAGFFLLNNQQNNAIVEESQSNNSTATSSAIPADWQTYTDQEFSYSLQYPSDFEATNNGKNSMTFDKKTEGQKVPGMDFVYVSVIPAGLQSGGGDIYNYNTEETSKLLAMKVGETKVMRGADDPYVARAFTYTRLPDARIGDFNAQAYLNEHPWEFPSDTVQYRYYIKKGNNLYMIGGYIGNTLSEEQFQQIVNGFKL